MIDWNEQRLEELVRIMKLRRTPGQKKPPIHLSLYNPGSKPLLTEIMKLDTAAWSALGYDETDRVSVTRYLGSLGCRTDDALLVATIYQRPLVPELVKALLDVGACDKGALSAAVRYQRPLSPGLTKALINARAFNKGALSNAACSQQPLTFELAKALIDAGACNKQSLSEAARHQRPLTLELAKLLIDAGACNKQSLSEAARHQRPLTLELAKLLIDAGCDPAAQDGDGWDALVCLASGNHPVDPQVTDLFLSAGCRTDLDGCTGIFDERRLRFDRILKEHAEWMTKRLDRECALESPPCDLNWGW